MQYIVFLLDRELLASVACKHGLSTNLIYNLASNRKDCRCETNFKHNGTIERSLVELSKCITNFQLSMYCFQRVEYTNLKRTLTVKYETTCVSN